jgi:indole-3-acetate monooxygenase
MPRADNPLEAVRRLLPMVEERAVGAEERARLDDDVVEALVASGTMTLMVPAVLGGGEAAPSVQLDVLEALSYADGSTGWAVMASMTSIGTFLSLLPDAGVNRILGSGEFIMAGAVTPPGQAVAVQDGYRVTGRFSFGSGSAHAGWFIGGYIVVDDAGQPVVAADGRPQTLFGAMRSAQVDLMGNWDVLGLVATASSDYEVRDQPIDGDLIAPGERAIRGGALYGMGLKSLPGLGHGGVVLGIAGRALDEFCALAQSKSRPPAGLLSKHEVVQSEFSHWRAELRGARAFVHEAYNRLFEATAAGEPLDAAMAADCRLSSAHAAYTAARLTEWVYLNSGSAGLRNGGVLQRCYRDAHAASQHLFTGRQVYVEAGRIYLGTPGLTPAHRQMMVSTYAPPLV